MVGVLLWCTRPDAISSRDGELPFLISRSGPVFRSEFCGIERKKPILKTIMYGPGGKLQTDVFTRGPVRGQPKTLPS